jgi:hypothetical protein
MGGASGFPTGRFVHENLDWAFDFDEDGTWRIFVGDMTAPALGK